MDLIKIVCVNLDRRFDRLKKFVVEMDKNNIQEYDRFSAIDGYRLVMSDYLKKIFDGNKFNWRPGVMGCALSHYFIWKDLCYSNYKYFMVLEDDITLAYNFTKYFDIVKQKINSCVYPFIYMGYSMDPKLENHVLNVPELIISTIINRNILWGGTFGYIIHRDLAKQFVNEIETHGIKEPIDAFIMRQQGLHEIVPQLVKSPVMVAYLDSDTDIQFDVLNMFDNYIFIRSLDVIGCDIKGVGRQSIDKLIAIANETENCVAFNSYGYLKNEIVAPKDLQPIQGNSLKTDGIYIKIIKTEDYDFYPCMDSVGNNIKSVGKLSLDELKQLAESDNKCVAFNTNGELKFAISNPKDFILIDNKKYKDISKNEGLYVKKNGLKISLDENNKVVFTNVNHCINNYDFLYK